MTYIDLANNFWNAHRRQPIPGSATHLFYWLLDQFSEGRDRARKGNCLPDTIRRTDGALWAGSGLSVNTAKGARTLLANRGLLWFKPVGSGKKGGAIYSLTSSISDEVSDEVEGQTSSNFDEVETQPHQKPRQPPRQNLMRSTIYSIPEPERELKQLLPEAEEVDENEPAFFRLADSNPEGPLAAFTPPPTPAPDATADDVRADLQARGAARRYAIEQLKLASSETEYSQLIELFITQRENEADDGKPAFGTLQKTRAHFSRWLGYRHQHNIQLKPHENTKHPKTAGRVEPLQGQAFGSWSGSRFRRDTGTD